MVLQQERIVVPAAEQPATQLQCVCAQATFQRSLSLVARAVSKSSMDIGAMPLLAYLRLEVRESQLIVASTNLEISIISRIDLKEKLETMREGVVIVPARLLLELVANMPIGQVHLSVDAGYMLTLRHASGTAQLKGMSAEQYFPLPDASEGEFPVVLPVGPLKEVIRQVSVAAAREESNYALTCIFVQREKDSVVFAATDRSRTAFASLRLSEASDSPCDLLIPQRSLLELAAVLPGDGGVMMSVTPNRAQVLFHTQWMTFSSRLIDGRFPNYAAIIPKKEDRQTRVVLATAAFEELVRLTSIYASTQEGKGVLRVTIKGSLGMEPGQLLIASEATEMGSGQNALAVVVEGEDAGPIHFSYKFLLDALAVTTTSEVSLEIALMKVKAPNDTFVTAPVALLKPIGSTVCTHLISSLHTNDE